MNRTFIFFFVLMFVSFSGIYAQRGRMHPRLEQINAEKIAFYTERMSLSPEEAKVFWPVYNDMFSRKEKIFNERKTLSEYFRSNRENLKEKEFEQLSDKVIELQIQEAKLSEEFHKKLKTILPAEKVMVLYQSESEFRNHLLRRLSGGGKGSMQKDGMDK